MSKYVGRSQKLKILSFIVGITTLYGCQSGQSNPQNSSASSNTCPNQPTGTLDTKDVKPISINTQSFKASDTIGFGQNLGYSFDGKAGDKLSWKTSENICIWVFAPSTKLLKGNELTENGKHTIQVSVPTGRTTFTLEMGLGNTVAASTPVASVTTSPVTTSPVATSPIATTSQPTNNLVQPPPTNQPTSGSSLNQDQAAAIVQTWLNSKGRVFAPPFDRQLARQLTTGTRYNQIMQSGGSIDWLKDNNSYYTYAITRVDNVWAFDNSKSLVEIKLRVTEDITLHNSNGGVDAERSGKTTANYIYYLAQDNGTWKIHDSRKTSD